MKNLIKILSMKNVFINSFLNFLLFSSFFFVHHSFAQCDQVAGPNNPATAIDQSFAGSSFSFSNPTNVFTSNNSYAIASATLFLLVGKTDYLVATNFNFSIPTGVIICGIGVSVEKSATGINVLSSVSDYKVSLVKNNVIVGNNYASPALWTGSDATTTYGGNGDLWGTTWAVSDITSGNFGVAFSAQLNGVLSLFPSARIDNVTITVYYDISPLAIKLNSFNATPSANKSAIINWSASATDNNSNYIVERSSDGSNWQKIDTIKSSNDGLIENYYYEDVHPITGQSYYRLNITSPGAKDYFSEIKPFYISPYAAIQIYPNPSSDYIIVNNAGNNPSIKITDVLGRSYPLTYNNSYSGEANINIQSLPGGIYFILVNKNAYTFIKK